jgi:DNA repair exonuclease SbcCD ATPase subunit
MISIDHLVLRDFMAIAEADLDFRGSLINVFHGPNGAGKSSLVEAIAICFTERKRGDSYKDFIKHGSEEGASVVLHATIHGEPIKFDIKIRDRQGIAPVTRIITYKGLEYKNSECTPLLESFDLEYLQQILFSMQGDSNITDLKPGDRTKVLKRLFNYEFTPQLEQIDALMLADQQALVINSTKLTEAQKRTFTYQPLRPVLSPVAKQNLQVRLAELKALEADVKAKEESKSGLRRQFDAVNAQVNATSEQETRAIEDTNRFLGNVTAYRASIKKYEDSLAHLGSDTERLNLIAQKQETIAQLESLAASNESLHTELGKQIDARQTDINRLLSHIEAHEKGECPKCGQATKPEKVPLMREMLEKEQATLSQLATQRRGALAKGHDTTKSIQTLRAEVQSLQNQIATNKTLRTQTEDFLKVTRASLKNEETAWAAKLKESQDLGTKKSSLLLELAGLRRQLEVDGASFDWGFLEISSIERELNDDALNVQVNDEITRLNTVTKKEEEGIEAERSRLARVQNDTLSRLNNYKEAKQILEVHLPNYVIVKACSKLEQHINGFIENVKPGMQVRLFQNKRGVEFFYSPKGASVKMEEWMTTRMASGFERELLAMAWRVALAQAYNLTLLMLDEIDSAAAVGTSEKMFRELANLPSFKQLFIITHKPEIVDILTQESDKVASYFVDKGTFTLQSY